MLFRSLPRTFIFSLLSVSLLTALLGAFASPAAASGDDVSGLAFVAADASTYDHSSGGGMLGSDVDAGTSSLNGGDFACGDTVSFLNVVEMDATATNTPQTIELTNTFSANAGGVGFTDIMNIVIDPQDPGQVNNDGSQIGVVGFGIDSDGVAPYLDDGDVLSGASDRLFATYVVDDLDPGEKVVVRVDVRLECAPGATPSGSLTGSLAMAGIVADSTGGLTFDPAAGSDLEVQMSAEGVSGLQAGGAVGDTADAAPDELPLTGDGSDLAALIAVAIIGAGLIVLGASYRRGVGA